MARRLPFVQYLTTGGDGSGLVNQAAAWTNASPGFFRVEAGNGQRLTIHTFVISIASAQPFSVGNYGSVPPLVSGVQFELRSKSLVIDTLDGFRIRHNQEWYSLGRTWLESFDGPGHVLTCHVRFAPVFGTPLTLETSDYLGMRLRDDLSGLSQQLALVTGTVEF